MNLHRAMASRTKGLDQAANGRNKVVKRAPMFTAVVVVLLRGPDVRLPGKVALGFLWWE